jgi:hypothetical protein
MALWVMSSTPNGTSSLALGEILKEGFAGCTIGHSVAGGFAFQHLTRLIFSAGRLAKS